MGLPERTGGAVLAGVGSGYRAPASAGDGLFSFLVKAASGGYAPHSSHQQPDASTIRATARDAACIPIIRARHFSPSSRLAGDVMAS
jgi:hypothetical protein